MRAQTAPEVTLLAGANYGIHVRVWVANGDGTLIDYSDWVERITINRNIDQPVDELTIEFRRDSGATLSLSPLRTDSLLNRLDDGTTYAPALDANRLIVVEPATVANTATPGAGDWKELFRGYIGSVDAASPTVNVVAQDQGRRLVKRWIKTENKYGFDESLETVMQQVADDTLGAGVLPIYVVGTPTFNINDYMQQSEPVMNALRTLAQERAWDFRYLWDDGTSTFRPTLYEPPRSKTIPDRTFGPDSYFSASRFEISDEDVRNYLTVNWRNSAKAYAREDMTVTDQDSIDRYEEQFYGITLGDESSLDTAAEVALLLGNILLDLKDPLAEFEVEAQFFWPAELNDLYRFSPNDVHFNTNQDWAVTGIRHELYGGTGRTYLQVRGKPSGGFLTWIGLKSQPPSATEKQIRNFRRISTDEIAGTETWGWENGGLIAENWAGFLTFDYPEPADPWAEVSASVLPLDTGVNTITFPVPGVGSGKVLYLQVEGRNANLEATDVKRHRQEAAVPDIPAIEHDDSETATVGTFWIKIRERGIAVTSVEAQTQIEQVFSAWGTPDRSEGDASVVKGGVLGSGEYEHDVARWGGGSSWITYQITLETGEIMTWGPMAFDPNAEPNIISGPTVVGTVITASGDSDVSSWKLRDKNGTWEYTLDGFQTGPIDVSEEGTNAEAGIGTAETWTVEVCAYSEPVAYVDGSTPSDCRDVQVSGGTAPAEPVWDATRAFAPSGIGNTDSTVALDADSAPVGYTARVWSRYNDGNGWTTFSDVTASLSPALSAPPTSATTYTYTVPAIHTMIDSSTAGAVKITYEFRLEILNGSSVVVATVTRSAAWYIEGPF